MARPIRMAVGCVALVALAACGGDDGDRDTEAPPTSTTETSSTSTPSVDGDRPSTSTTTTTMAAEVDQVAVARALQELAERYDAAVAAILTDPRVAGDPAHPAVLGYLDLFVQDSEFAAGALDAWAQEGAEGRFYRPGPRGRMSESTVSDVEVGDGGTATFSMCSITSVEIVDAAGRPVSGEGGQTAATVVAERVGATWLLRELSETSPEECEPVANEAPA